MNVTRLIPAVVLLAAVLSACSSSNESAPTTSPEAAPSIPAACERALGAATANPLTAERLTASAAGMVAVAAEARNGNLEGAERLFFSDTHAVTHDIDAPLREVDAELAKELCASVFVIETELAPQGDLRSVADEAERSAGLLTESIDTLGLAR